MAAIRIERILPYPRPDVFDLVADVERYPEFVPGCRDARITHREGDHLTVEQELGVRGWTWRFATEARFERPKRIHITSRQAPFRYLDQEWRFDALGERETSIVLAVDYALRNPIVARLASTMFDEAFRRTLAAFEQRARQCIG